MSLGEGDKIEKLAAGQKRLQDLCRSLQKDRDEAQAQLVALKESLASRNTPSTAGETPGKDSAEV